MPLFDGSTDAPSLTLQVDPSALSEFTLDLSLLDGADPLGSTPAWTTISNDYIRAIAIRRGRSREDQPNDAGSMLVELDNRTGYFDPDNGNPSNPFTSNGESWWRSGLPARLIATWDSVDYRLYTGRLNEPAADLGLFPIATFEFLDGIADASAPLTGYTAVVETTAQRANRVLDLMGWPSTDRSIVGSKALLASGQTGSATAVIEECAKAEVGRFYVDASGRMCLTDRADAIARTVELTLSDEGTAGTINYLTLNVSPGMRSVVNEATATNGSYTATVTNTSSIAQTRIKRPVSVDVPLSSSSDLDTLATFLANRRATPSTRVDSLELQAFGIGTAWSSLLAVDLGDQIQVQRTSTNGIGLDVVLCAEGISHTISPRSWLVGMSTAPVDAVGSTFTLDTSLLNGTDVLAA